MFFLLLIAQFIVTIGCQSVFFLVSGDNCRKRYKCKICTQKERRVRRILVDFEMSKPKCKRPW